MNKESLYLDTSVPGAYFDDREKERFKATRKFWYDIVPDYNVFVSDVTLDEIKGTREDILRKDLLCIIEPFEIIKKNNETEILAKEYLKNNIIPERYFIDALHIAIASYYLINYIVSWNFEHIVKVKTRRIVNLVNILKGYREIEIISPLEL
ncbi:MAG: PIN domain-containing protein [Spirochaetales bacterium]|nr:PIN domain-containing protein [Spirochaetales bacterium]